MKNRFLPNGLITAFLGLSLLFFTVFSMAGQPGNPELRKFDGSRWETIRANQNTGMVNPQDVIKARQQAESLRFKSTSGAMGLNWLPVGPDNFTGLVWSAIFDNQDPAYLTIIAGSSTGGLWKSINMGLTWNPMLVQNNLVPKVSSMVQASDGTIYAATGVSTCKTVKFNGNGIFRLNTTGDFSLIPGTMGNPDFNGVTKLAINKQSGRIFAATYGGVYYSDNGNDWVKALPGYAMDVVVGPDGTVLMEVGDSAYMAPAGDLSARVTLTTGNVNALPKTGFGWMTFAIAPSDANVMYASLSGNDGKMMSIYTSIDKGATWSVVFPNNPSFEPFGAGYGCYSNTMAVFPNDPDKLFLGGVNMWYGQRVLSTGYYNWEQVSFGSFGNLSPYFAPSYHHSYMFRPNSANELVMATDGGVTMATVGSAGVTFQTSNKNMESGQFNSVTFSAQKSFVMGGGDRVGTLALGYFYPSQVNSAYEGYQVYRTDASALGDNYQPQPASFGGNGGSCVWSNIDSKIAVYTKYKGAPAIRRQDFTDIYNYNNFSAAVDTVSSAYVPMQLWESFKFTQTHDSVRYYARVEAIPAGTTIMVPSLSNKFMFPYVTPVAIPKDDSLMVPDPIASRFIIYGDSDLVRGIYMTNDMLKFNKETEYFCLFKDKVTNDPVTALSVSADLNTTWAGTKAGRLIRLTGLINAYDSATANITSSQCVIVDTVYANTPFTGRVVTSISIDPSNSNHVLVTLGNYGNQNYVYYSQNAGDVSPLFASVQSNLPQSPVYTGLLEMHGGNAILGTDLGVFTTTSLNSGSPQWAADMQNIGDVAVTDIRQQVLRDYHIQNLGVIYLASYGRGLWMDTTYYSPVGIDPVNVHVNNHDRLILNPNPVKDNLFISYENEASGNLNLSVYDLTGHLLITSPLGLQPKGTFRASVNLGGLVHGTYVVKVGNASGKIVKL